MHCVVLHELAHLLYYKVYKTIDCVEIQEKPSHGGIDYGTEVEHHLFGGRMLSTADFAGLRIERKNGEVYEMDIDYFFDDVMELSNRKVDFDRLSKVDADVDSPAYQCTVWWPLSRVRSHIRWWLCPWWIRSAARRLRPWSRREV